MPDPRIPIIAGALLQEWRAEFVARPFEAVAARVVEALDRAVPVPAADQVEIVARALDNARCDRWGIPHRWDQDAGAGESYREPTREDARTVITALSAAPRVTEVSDAMVDAVLDVFHGSRFWRKNQASQRRRMRAALSAALAGQDGEAVADGLRACADAVVKAWNGMTPEQDPAEELWQPMHDLSNALRPTSPPADSGSGWQPIATAPLNTSILIFIPNLEHYGPGIYRAIHVDIGTGKRWHATTVAMGRDLRRDMMPTHWRPLPDPPIPPVEPGGGE